jgi:hypothetical protein
MVSERIIPDNPLAFVQRCVRERKVFWTYHVQMRLKGRTLSREALLRSVESYEVLEAYPDDKYLPSYLVYCDSEEVWRTFTSLPMLPATTSEL